MTIRVIAIIRIPFFFNHRRVKLMKKITMRRMIGFGFGFMLPKIVKTVVKIGVILGIGYLSTRGYKKVKNSA